MNGSKLRRQAVRGLVATVATGALMVGTLGSAGAATRQSDCHNSVDVASLRVKMKALKPVYHHGDVAKVRVTVLRTVDEARLPEPAQYVNVDLNMAHDWSLLHDAGKTDGLGVTTLKLKLDRQTPLGMAQVKADAWNGPEASGPCGARVVERGSLRNDYLFKVVR